MGDSVEIYRSALHAYRKAQKDFAKGLITRGEAREYNRLYRDARAAVVRSRGIQFARLVETEG